MSCKENVGISAAAAVVAGLMVGLAGPGQAQSRQPEMPNWYLWVHVIKGGLAMGGDTFFEQYLNRVSLPPVDTETTPQTPQYFRGHIISMTPAVGPKELTVGIEKVDVADAKLEFENALPGAMKPGGEIEFKGVVKSWTRDPILMITFEVLDPKADLKGWAGSNMPTKAAPK